MKVILTTLFLSLFSIVQAQTAGIDSASDLSDNDLTDNDLTDNLAGDDTKEFAKQEELASIGEIQVSVEKNNIAFNEVHSPKTPSVNRQLESFEVENFEVESFEASGQPSKISAEIPNELIVSDSDGTEMTIQSFPATSSLLVIWLDDHSEHRPKYEGLLKSIHQHNISLWRTNPIESYFIPRSNENIRTMPGDAVATLIQAALERTDKQIIVASYERMPLPILRGVRQWQQNHPQNDRFLGSILFYPNLFGPPPLAGEDPVLDSIVSASNYPLVIYQPDSGSQRLRIGQVMEAFWQAGTPAVTYLVPNVRDWFFMGDGDHGIGEKDAIHHIPQQFFQFAKILADLPKPKKALSEKKKAFHHAISGLVKYQANMATPNYELVDFKTEKTYKSDFKGKVTLLNFWATWCPPCVEEIPSLNRLQERYRDQPFELISIDYREDKEQLKQFIQQIAVEFPVLLDENGKTSLDWKVFSFPSSFIIDKQGRIRYSANRAIDWNTQEVWQAIDTLLSES